MKFSSLIGEEFEIDGSTYIVTDGEINGEEILSRIKKEINMLKTKNKRKTPLISKKSIVSAINLYEEKIDDEIYNIKILSKYLYEIQGYHASYTVDIQSNTVNKCYPDPDWS